MITRTNLFKSLVQIKTRNYINVPNSNNSGGNEVFSNLSELQRIEILSTIESLQNYQTQTKITNDRRFKLFKLMSWRQQKLCTKIGYIHKLKLIESSIQKNQLFLNDVANELIKKYNITYKDFQILKTSTKQNTSSSNYRVIEALGHYLRDWQDSTKIPKELVPIHDYISQQLSNIIPESEMSSTCLIFPGSGLGRLSYEFSKNSQFGKIYSIEYSGIMNAFTNFNYTQKESDYSIYPYIHTCSNFYNQESQFRSFTYDLNLEKSENLSIVEKDFTLFEIPKEEIDSYKNVVIISCFFVDTAENLLDYLDTFEKLTTYKNVRGYWINAGPLKYGTAAQVELNADELKELRVDMGWKDLHSEYTVLESKTNNDKNNGLVGYVTDDQSMWQGFYGLNMFSCERKENNKRKQ